MAQFPTWFENGSVIGQNADGESLAVGLRDGVAWLARLDNVMNKWVAVRPASREEVGTYDERFLANMRVTLDGNNRR